MDRVCVEGEGERGGIKGRKGGYVQEGREG